VLVQEFVDNIGAEGERYTSVVFCPAGNVLFRIGPKQIAEEARVGDVRRSVDSPDLLHVLKIGRKTAVAAEDLVIDDRSDRKTVEAIWKKIFNKKCFKNSTCKSLPDFYRETSLALVIKAVNSIDTCALVVSSQQEEVLRIFYLQIRFKISWNK